MSFFFFFFNDTATTEIYTLSLHDALPISNAAPSRASSCTDGRLDREDRARRRHRRAAVPVVFPGADAVLPASARLPPRVAPRGRGGDCRRRGRRQAPRLAGKGQWRARAARHLLRRQRGGGFLARRPCGPICRLVAVARELSWLRGERRQARGEGAPRGRAGDP